MLGARPQRSWTHHARSENSSTNAKKVTVSVLYWYEKLSGSQPAIFGTDPERGRIFFFPFLSLSAPHQFLIFVCKRLLAEHAFTTCFRCPHLHLAQELPCASIGSCQSFRDVCCQKEPSPVGRKLLMERVSVRHLRNQMRGVAANDYRDAFENRLGLQPSQGTSW